MMTELNDLKSEFCFWVKHERILEAAYLHLQIIQKEIELIAQGKLKPEDMTV